MKRVRLVTFFVILWFGCISSGQEQQATSPKVLDTLQTLDGKTYTSVTLKRTREDQALIFHSQGTAWIQFDNLSDEMRVTLGLPSREEYATQEKKNAEDALTKKKVQEERARAEKKKQEEYEKSQHAKGLVLYEYEVDGEKNTVWITPEERTRREERSALLRLGDKELNARIEDLKKKIPSKDAIRNSGLMYYGAPPDIYTDKLKEYESQHGKFFPTLELKPASVGVFRATRLKTESYHGNRSYSWVRDSITVRTIVDTDNMIVDWDGDEVWIHGARTADLVDGKAVRPSGIFKYAGTKQYNGSTMYVIERIGDE